MLSSATVIDFVFSCLRLLIQICLLVHAVMTRNEDPPLIFRPASNFIFFFRRNPLAAVEDVEAEKERRRARRLGILITLCGIVVLEVFHLLGIYHQVFTDTMALSLQFCFWVAAVWALYEVRHW